jgi:hypothetical protein
VTIPALFEVSVLPLHAQVAIQDVSADDLPEWTTGEERVVSSARAVLVATRPDTQGDVLLRVLRLTGRESLEVPGECVYEGSLLLSGSQIEVGNALAGSLFKVDVGCTGSVPLRIFVHPPSMPACVTVVVGEGNRLAWLEPPE